MMPISSPFRNQSLMSARTAKYVEAMIRQGDGFDYDMWLKRVREEEAQAKQLSAASGAGAPLVQIKGPISASNVLKPAVSAVIKGVAVPRTIWRPRHEVRVNGPARWLKRVADAWGEFQANRARDAVYAYLEAVFAIVDQYKVRHRTNKLMRHASEIAGLPLGKNADPFIAVIRCTCDGAADSKMISKWARALRYAAIRKRPEMRLKAFMKQTGGVNECAARYADKRRRHRRPHC
jgi:hypothetical protein